MNEHAYRIRTGAVFAALAYLAASVAFSQSADLPNRHGALEGITAAGQPSEAGLAAIAAAGFRSVIDLRGVNEDRGFDERQAEARARALLDRQPGRRLARFASQSQRR